jgi:hypothetical protein
MERADALGPLAEEPNQKDNEKDAEHESPNASHNCNTTTSQASTNDVSAFHHQPKGN